MKMSITLSHFPMDRLEPFKEAVAQYAKCDIRVSADNSVEVACEADMIKCQEVVIISDLYWSGGEIGGQKKKESHEEAGQPE